MREKNMTDKPSTGGNVRREDLYGRPLKAQTYEILVTTHEQIRERSKEFKVTAPELLEVLMNHTDWNAMAPMLQQVRQNKEAQRAKNLQAKKEREMLAVAADPKALSLAKQLKELPPEKLAEIQALIASAKQ